MIKILFTIIFHFGLVAPVLAVQELRDIRPPVLFPPSYIILYVFGVLCLFTIIAILVRKYFKPNRNQKVSDVPQKSADEIAYERLKLLVKKNYIGQGMVKEYFTELSDILRMYIENRFGVRAPEMTTPEFLIKIKSSAELKLQHKDVLKEFLNICDLVKFAKYGPTSKEIDEAFELVKQFVDETKRRKEEEVTA